MKITNDMLLDILENLSDDELRLFLEHLASNNEDVKESLYKYYIGLLNYKFIDKSNYKERILSEIKVDKIHPYAFVSFYELINNSINKYDKDKDDFLYELIFEAYINLSLKYTKIDFNDLFNYLDNVSTSLTNATLEVITNKINILKNNKIYLKIDLLTKLLKYISKYDLSTYLDTFYNVYEISEDKDIYLALIDYIFSYIQKNYTKLKAIQFLEYFANENYRINHTVVSYYKNEEDYDKAIITLNKVNTSKLKENEYKDYLLSKGQIYKKLGSNTLYFKSLIDLVLHNHFEYLNTLKEEQQERDFKASLSFIIDNLNINKNSNLSLLHKILKDNESSYGLITFFNYFDKDLLYEDILYFKEINIEEASLLYEYYILELAKVCKNNALLNSLNEHVLEFKRNYLCKDFSKLLNTLKNNLKKEYYNFIYQNLLNEF